uniref:Methyltransferase domain-containing protein n=1 Tax=Candidatus Kentrum sp. MB TaxID=2138164 RepID=A0A451BFS5_9GAMM|nr:MAG: Methyltransferase domain-containing protein [Candidatus Kentron sp. MB]VFK35174.1 MAG: Methyltransferase domain-containing protein [Candidatus Kentron sp. MB]VFK77107.1 MAG: Methyltransferase domain-containing protein [Candidatus Kentron sp. MB]
MNKLNEQYNSVSDYFSEIQSDYNKSSNERYYDFLQKIDFSGKIVIDLGCGDGTDLINFKESGAKVLGIDTSAGLADMARSKGLDVRIADLSELDFPRSSIDIVTSKYALQTSHDLSKIFSGVLRILKPGGIFYFLVVHPFRQFIEKKTPGADYFEQTIVDSIIFDGSLTIKEPTHTMEHYINNDILESFKLIHYKEEADFFSAERIGGMNYPTFLVICYEKK